jgi:hypothetical protein
MGCTWVWTPNLADVDLKNTFLYMFNMFGPFFSTTQLFPLPLRCHYPWLSSTITLLHVWESILWFLVCNFWWSLESLAAPNSTSLAMFQACSVQTIPRPQIHPEFGADRRKCARSSLRTCSARLGPPSWTFSWNMFLHRNWTWAI